MPAILSYIGPVIRNPVLCGFNKVSSTLSALLQRLAIVLNFCMLQISYNCTFQRVNIRDADQTGQM